MLKSYIRGDEIPDRWINLFWRAALRDRPGRELCFRIKCPWKVRGYSVNSDEIRMTRPCIYISLWCQHDRFTHSFSKEEMLRRHQ